MGLGEGVGVGVAEGLGEGDCAAGSERVPIPEADVVRSVLWTVAANAGTIAAINDAGAVAVISDLTIFFTS